ncbi:deoxyribose-phosphate aldolase [Bacteriovorax sp. DB6_IX]|uniref:deoxyribose-phosphate aldolase n=1 Tax=Bacteriovorax sp. DB6_IX TaxID=1353530 RepID=UPI00038A30A8|nr:deoxyribose-phosphate aldolase [Bacteriovorax sp. DB6_IX]EQC50777.1 deoxyribose-phosphate aldolase [Bacteriovorax sp. DB6_IX]
MNKYIDHTLLKPQSTSTEIINLCKEAKKYDFKSVCINPTWIKLAANELSQSDVLVCTVIGFPLGATSSESKAFETRQAIADGADEVDMVLNIGALKSGEDQRVEDDVRAVVEAANGKTVKVILETCLLSDDEITKASKLCVNAGAHFVKTSTGFSTHGATEEAVKLMVAAVEGRAQIKASGGVRSAQDAQKYIDLGATRLGTSSGVAIVNNEKSESAY